MERRKFIKVSALAAAGTTKAVPAVGKPLQSSGRKLTAADINQYLRSLCQVKEPSVDRVVIGDPGTEVKIIGTAWMPYWKTLRKAADKGINTLVVHEPAFYSHWDLDNENPEYTRQTEAGKKAYLEAVLQIGIDDTIRTWTQTAFAEDTGLPLIVINHGTSEEFGMRSLNRKLREAFPGYEVEPLPQGCGYRWVTV